MRLTRLRVDTSPFNQVLYFIPFTPFVFDAFDLQDRILTVDLVRRVEHRPVGSVAELFHEGIKSDRISLRGAVVWAGAQGKLSVIDRAAHDFDGRMEDIARGRTVPGDWNNPISPWGDRRLTNPDTFASWQVKLGLTVYRLSPCSRLRPEDVTFFEITV